MRKIKLLTLKNRKVLYNAIKKYLLEVLEEEDYTDTLEKCYSEAYRVQIPYYSRMLTPSVIEDWFRGLPINTMYMTYNIVRFLFQSLGLDAKEADLTGTKYIEDDFMLDNFYWYTLGEIVYNEHGKAK